MRREINQRKLLRYTGHDAVHLHIIRIRIEYYTFVRRMFVRKHTRNVWYSITCPHGLSLNIGFMGRLVGNYLNYAPTIKHNMGTLLRPAVKICSYDGLLYSLKNTLFFVSFFKKNASTDFVQRSQQRRRLGYGIRTGIPSKT